MMASTYKPIRFKAFPGFRRRGSLACLLVMLAFADTSSFSQSRAVTQPLATSSDLSSSQAPAEDLDMETLELARRAVGRIFERSADMVCVESVNQTILDSQGRMAYQEHSLFNYRLQANAAGKSLKFVEARQKIEAPFHDPNRTVLITDGFGNMLLILHPEYRGGYTFEAQGQEEVGGINAVKYNFKAIPGASSPVMLQIRGENYSVDLDGTVWIEPGSGNVVKLVAYSSSNMDELGVHSMRSEIEYLPAALHNPEESYWMPASAVIDVETMHRHWRNIHRFSMYKRFQPSTPTEERAGNLDSTENEK